MTLTLLQMHRYGNILPADLEKQTYLIPLLMGPLPILALKKLLVKSQTPFLNSIFFPLL